MVSHDVLGSLTELCQERRKAIRAVICSPFNVKKSAESTLISLGADFIFVFCCVFFFKGQLAEIAPCCRHIQKDAD